MKDLKPGQIGCVPTKYNELEIYEQTEKGLNVGIGAIKFDLTAEQKKYIQGEKRPAVEELQRIIDNFYQLEERNGEAIECLFDIAQRFSRVFPLLEEDRELLFKAEKIIKTARGKLKTECPIANKECPIEQGKAGGK